MPELPEMENYKRLLMENIGNKTITNIQVNREKSINVSIDFFIDCVRLQKVLHVERRAKLLVFHLENGYKLLLHLMLGGFMYFGREEDKPDRTVQIQFSFGEEDLYFIGLRLGYLHLLTESEVSDELEKLGPEPLDINYSLDAFLKLIEGKRGRVKTTLIDQEFLSGIGNCYSDEICYDAQILPTKGIDELTNEEGGNLFHSIRRVLNLGIENGGYMDQPFFPGDVRTGGVRKFLKVYDRESEQCSRCGDIIIKEEISSRKCFYCKGCQR
jgi:formamidopyrimidine-DNA glycosylase